LHYRLSQELHPAIESANETDVELGNDRENGREEARNPALIRLFYRHTHTGRDNQPSKPTLSITRRASIGDIIRRPVELLAGQELIPKPAVERLDVAILPRASGLDEQGLHADLVEPLTHLLGCELRPLSERMYLGTPRRTNRSLSRSNTSSLLSLLATSIARHSRVNSSITTNSRIYRRYSVRSVTKSYDQT